MDIKEIFERNADSAGIIAELKRGRGSELPDVALAIKAIDQNKYDINDKSIRPDKMVKVDTPDSGFTKVTSGIGSEGTMRVESVARIRLAIQKLIIRRAVSFLFGNDVVYNIDTADEVGEMIAKAFGKIIKDTKSNTQNRKVARAMFGYKECAELWYPVELPAESQRMGFKSKFKLRCAVFSPAFGDTLYPYFDETGDMIAFSRSYNERSAIKMCHTSRPIPIRSITFG